MALGRLQREKDRQVRSLEERLTSLQRDKKALEEELLRARAPPAELQHLRALQQEVLSLRGRQAAGEGERAGLALQLEQAAAQQGELRQGLLDQRGRAEGAEARLQQALLEGEGLAEQLRDSQAALHRALADSGIARVAAEKARLAADEQQARADALARVLADSQQQLDLRRRELPSWPADRPWPRPQPPRQTCCSG